MQATLDQLAADMRDRIALDATKAASQVIADAMRERAPERVITTPHSNAIPRGALKRDIRVKATLDADAGMVVATIGPSHYAHVARWVEYGHRLVKGGSSKVLGSGKTSGAGAEIGEVPPHPFLRPAFGESLQQAMETFRATPAQGITEVLR